MLDLVIPAVGGFAQIARPLLPSAGFHDIGRREKPGDLDREREGRIARVLLPAVLARYRSVAKQIPRCSCDHGEEPVLLGCAQMAAPSQHVGEQDRKGAFIHLHAAPVGLAVEPSVLRPMAIRLLN